MINILCIILGCAIGCFGIYFYLKPQLENTIAINTEKIANNQAIDEKNKELNSLNEYLSQKNNELSQEYTKLQTSIEEASKSFKNLTASLEASADEMFKQSKQIADEKMKVAQRELQDKYEKQQKELELTLELKKASYKEQSEVLAVQAQKQQARLDELTSKVQNALEAARRQEEIESNIDYYRIVLSDEDKNEIKAIKSIEHLISNKRNIKLFMWTYYYSKRANELAARVLGATDVCGIYKITNMETQQVYIGQSRSVRERWREHIKAGGLDIDRPTTNKLYQNMQKYGIENFTFELMEKCSKEELDSREKHWIEFYQSSVLGLNSQSGNGK